MQVTEKDTIWVQCRCCCGRDTFLTLKEISPKLVCEMVSYYYEVQGLIGNSEFEI